ncbi:hypothetical protein [Catalinimonas alkaloidigena]|nr:hypothetical protein [Catalinimonas alkaloidigena]
MKPHAMFRKGLILAGLLCVLAGTAQAMVPGDSLAPATTRTIVPANTKASLLNVKVVPGFFWNTAGLELEATLSGSFSAGVVGHFKWGPGDGQRDNYRLVDQDYNHAGYLIDGFVRYFPLQPAPSGWYVQATASYGTLLYADASVRPYTLWMLRDLPKQADPLAPVAASQPYAFGVASGYQFLISRGHLIANLLGGAQLQFDEAQKPYVSLYFMPSVGFYF